MNKRFVIGGMLWLLLMTSVLFAAIGTPLRISGPSKASGIVDAKYVRAVSTMTDWATICSDAATTDNATATVVNPGGIARAEQRWVQMAGQGTTLQVRFKYPTAASSPTGPTVQVFGRGSNGVPSRLVNVSDGQHAIALTVDTTNDARDTTYSYTQPVEVDANANKECLVAVKTAQGGSSMTGAAIQVRIK